MTLPKGYEYKLFNLNGQKLIGIAPDKEPICYSLYLDGGDLVFVKVNIDIKGEK